MSSVKEIESALGTYARLETRDPRLAGRSHLRPVGSQRRVRSQSPAGQTGNRRRRVRSRAQAGSRSVSAALQIYSRDFDADFFKLPAGLQVRIESSIDRLGMELDSYSHHRMKGIVAYRFRVGDYRVIYDFDRAKGVLHLLAVGHRREVYRK